MKGVDLNIKKKTIIVNAPMWKRIVAFLIDYMILEFFILSPFNNLIENMINTNSLEDIFAIFSGNSQNLHYFVYISIFMSIIAALYFIIMEKKWGQTIGKMIMKLDIMNLEVKSKKEAIGSIGFNKVLVRSIGILFLYIFPIITIADFIYAYFNKENQRWLEKATSTKTVSTTSI